MVLTMALFEKLTIEYAFPMNAWYKQKTSVFHFWYEQIKKPRF